MRTTSKIGKYSAAVLAGILFSFASYAQDKVDHEKYPWPLTDTFDTPPPRAHAAAGTSCVAAERYVTMVAAKQGREIGEVFAEDAAFLDPFGKLVKGRANIAAWYEAHRGAVEPTPISFIAAGHECFMEVAGRIPPDPDTRLHLTVIDHFTMNDKGEIVRAVYYFRGNVDAVKRVAELEAEIAKLKQSK